MKLEHARRIVNDAAGRGQELHLIEQYSGRGMFGRLTAAVSGAQSGIVLGIAAAAATLALGVEDEVTDSEMEDFLRAVARLSWDQMGQDVIAY